MAIAKATFSKPAPNPRADLTRTVRTAFGSPTGAFVHGCPPGWRRIGIGSKGDAGGKLGLQGNSGALRNSAKAGSL
jgi:hypothetical protein